MKSLILTTVNKIIIPVMLLFSVFLLFRGHNYPGGGFIGGLTAAASVILYAFGRGSEEALTKIKLRPVKIIAFGLLLSISSGLFGLVAGGGFFKGYWMKQEILFFPKLGTPLLFDVGVYLVVFGVVLMIVLPNIIKEN